MIDQSTELKAGGKVRISGVWVEIIDNGILVPNMNIASGDLPRLIHFIEAYEPPAAKVEPYEWIKAEDLIRLGSPKNLSEVLTERYGDPTIRTYADENADQFGITGATDVLVWVSAPNPCRWMESEFSFLNEGDQWRLQPAAPKGARS